MGHFFGSKSEIGADKVSSDIADTQLVRAASAHPADASEVSGLQHYRRVPAFGILQHAAETLPDREALRYGEDTWTYDELNHDSIKCAAMLQAHGVCPGDRVGILLPNVPEFVIAAAGVWRAGGIVVALSPLMVADEVDSLLIATNCKHVICLDVLSHMVEQSDQQVDSMWLVSIRKHLPAHRQIGYVWIRHSRTGHWSRPNDDRIHRFWESMNATTRRWQPISIDTETDPAYILPTGGTTGNPKAVTLSHQNMVANAWQQFERTQRSFGTESMMAVLPFFHSYGISAVMMSGAMMGASLILHHRFNTRQVIRSIEKNRPSVLHAVPAMLVAINERLRSRPADLSSIKWVISGGAPLEASIAEEFTDHSGAVVVEGFGLSEASPVTHVGDLFGAPRYGSIGLPLPETICRIVDSETGASEMADDQVGELVLRGPQVMLGYWNNRRATDQAIRDGWLFTGDLATRDSDGFFQIVGRKKDLIITSGFNVYPTEVEETLRAADGVLDAAVVGVPDSQRGERVKAFVVMKPGWAWDEVRLHEYCHTALAAHKRPRDFEHCIDDLPRNFLGKVIRRHLREEAAENLAEKLDPVERLTDVETHSSMETKETA